MFKTYGNHVSGAGEEEEQNLQKLCGLTNALANVPRMTQADVRLSKVSICTIRKSRKKVDSMERRNEDKGVPLPSPRNKTMDQLEPDAGPF